MGNLAIAGGEPLRTKPFPRWPVFDDRELQMLKDALESGVWGVGGKKIAEFEESFASFQGARFAIATASGTLALEVSMRAVDVGLGDEVILPSYTFIGTASSIKYVNATPVFVDIDPETYCIDPERVEDAINERTRAIVAVHMAGQPADMDHLTEIAEENGLTLIEDSAQAHSSEWDGRKVGAIGDLGVFSFQSSKNMTSGEGGAILTNDEDLYRKCWSLHNCGRAIGGEWYVHKTIGGNCRMTEFQAAVLLAQLGRLEGMTKLRERNASYLTERLTRIPGIEPLKRYPKVTAHSNHLYIFKYSEDEFQGLSRDRFIEALRAEGIPCSPGYTPLHEMKFLGGRNSGSLEVTEDACYRRAVWMKQNLLLGTREDMDDIAEAIIKIRENVGEII